MIIEGLGVPETLAAAVILAATVVYAVGMVVTQERDRRRRWRQRDREREALRAEPIDLFGEAMRPASQAADMDRADGLGAELPPETTA